MSDLISRQAAIDELMSWVEEHKNNAFGGCLFHWTGIKALLEDLPSAQPEIVRCCECGFWDRDTLSHQFKDFRDWNEAECKVLAERDPYHEINRYTEADDFCSYAERRAE